MEKHIHNDTTEAVPFEQQRIERGAICVEDYDEACEFIEEAYAQGERPVVTVPAKYADALRMGLHPHTTWIPGVEVIAATFGRDPYIPRDEPDRIRIIVDDVDVHCIKPRFTGTPPAFRGVVILQGPIAPEQLHAA